MTARRRHQRCSAPRLQRGEGFNSLQMRHGEGHSGLVRKFHRPRQPGSHNGAAELTRRHGAVIRKRWFMPRQIVMDPCTRLIVPAWPNAPDGLLIFWHPENSLRPVDACLGTPEWGLERATFSKLWTKVAPREARPSHLLALPLTFRSHNDDPVSLSCRSI